MKASNIENFRIFKIAYVASTNTRGPQIKIIESKRFMGNKTKTVTLSFDYGIGDILQQVINYLIERGFNIVGRASDSDYYYVFANNWGEDFKELK